MKPKMLYFQYRETYGGGDGRAINRHSVKVYRDDAGNEYRLDRNLSVCPPCFEILGPIPEGFQGITPVITVSGNKLWGDGMPWGKAEKIFFETIGGALC